MEPSNSIEIELGAWRLALRMEHGYPVAERTHIVRGIALKTEQLTLDAWITVTLPGALRPGRHQRTRACGDPVTAQVMKVHKDRLLGG